MLFLMRALACLPLPLLQAVGRCTGLLIYTLPGRYRQRLQANARQAGYNSGRFFRRAAAETGAMIAELPKIWFDHNRCIKKVSSAPSSCSDNSHLLHSAAPQNLAHTQLEPTPATQGVLYLTPHLGCFEITARYLTRFGPITVMYRPPRQQALDPVMQAARNTSGVRAVPATMQGVREFVRALRRGEAVGMLPDQAPGQGDGVWAPFFGRPAYTMTLAGKLALQTGVPVILIAGERLPHGKGWRIHQHRLPEPLPTDATELATLINQHMERLIRRFPEQYLWSYNRYKVPRGAPPPPS